MYLSTLETRNYSFQGLGFTKQQAVNAMKDAIEKHLRTNPYAKRSYFESILADDDYNVIEVHPGTGWIDNDSEPGETRIPVGDNVSLSVEEVSSLYSNKK
jgi:hypothetical protein